MIPAPERVYDVAIVGSGAGGGTVAQALAPLVRDGRRVVVFEQGPRFEDAEFTGRELEMASALYADGGGFLTAQGTMTLAFAQAYGGSTLVYTGTSLTAPERVIRHWGVPGLDHADLLRRSQHYLAENNVHLLPPEEINDNNRLFLEGGRRAGYRVEQFPVNVKGCRGSSLCNLGCPNQAKQGTNRVQLPQAERQGVEVVTRAEVLRIDPDRTLAVRVSEKAAGAKGRPSEWAPGEYRVRAGIVVCAGGVIGTTSLLLRSPLPRPRCVGEGFTCHPALILVAEHARPITNDVGHPKSYFVDRGAEQRFVLETCMYFPFTTAKALSGFGAAHSGVMRAFPRLQMILVLACDAATPGNRITVDGAGRPVVRYRFTEETPRFPRDQPVRDDHGARRPRGGSDPRGRPRPAWLAPPRAACAIAAAERSTSAAVVDQLEKDTRIAAAPCHVVPPNQQVPSCWTRVMTAWVNAPASPPAAGRKRTSTWFKTTSLRISAPGTARSRSAMRRARSQQRSTSAATPRRPSERRAA